MKKIFNLLFLLIIFGVFLNNNVAHGDDDDCVDALGFECTSEADCSVEATRGSSSCPGRQICCQIRNTTNYCTQNGFECAAATSCLNMVSTYNDYCGDQVCCNYEEDEDDNEEGEGNEDDATEISGITVTASSNDSAWESGLELIGTFNLPNNDPETIIISFLNWILSILAVITVLAFIISGVMLLISGGDPEQTKRAKDYIKYSIIGLAVALSGYIIVRFIDSLFLGYYY